MELKAFGEYCLVSLDEAKTRTASGLHLAQTGRTNINFHRGTVLSAGHKVNDGEQIIQPGDRIMYTKYVAYPDIDALVSVHASDIVAVEQE